MDEDAIAEYYQSSSDSCDKCVMELESMIDGHIKAQVVNDRSLSVGRQFDDYASFNQFIRSKSIIENFGMKIIASDKKRFIGRCAYIGCPWRVRASLCSDGHTFEVKKFEATHLCPGVNRAGNKQATSTWVAREIADLVKQHPDIPPKEINNFLERKFNLSLPYMKIWRSREMARDNLFGSVDDSYRWIPALRAELIKRNPDSHIMYDYNVTDSSFKSFFISFKVCVDGFLNGCRYLVGLDACHLKSKYLGVLMAANTLDGNNGLFTIAFAIVESESKRTWEWFLRNLAIALSLNGTCAKLSFISDMEKGLAEAMKIVFPDAEHRVCLRHLWKNIKKYFHTHNSQKIRNLFWVAANAYTEYEFENNFIQIAILSPELHAYLLKLPHKWARYQFSSEFKNQCNTNNMSESFNSWIGDIRGKPVVGLVDALRAMLMEQRVQRQSNSLTWEGELVPTVEEYLRNITTRRDSFIIKLSTSQKAEVEGLNDRYEVDIGKKHCSCRFWQMTGLPCIHAVTFIGSKGNPIWHTYVDDHYHVTRYRTAYEGAIATLPGKEQWIGPIEDPQIIAPLVIRPRGRPRKRRIKSFLEQNTGRRNIHKCGRCGEWGHHRNTCKKPLGQSSQSFPEVDSGSFIPEFNYTDYPSTSKLPVRRQRLSSVEP